MFMDTKIRWKAKVILFKEKEIMWKDQAIKWVEKEIFVSTIFLKNKKST